jgi:hypothetical protein
VYSCFAELSILEVNRHLVGLEEALQAAIDQVEDASSRPGQTEIIEPPRRPSKLSPDHYFTPSARQYEPVPSSSEAPPANPQPAHLFVFARPMLQFLGAIVLALAASVAIYGGVGGRFGYAGPPLPSVSDVGRNNELARSETTQALPSQSQTLPLPATFGVYAVSEGQLHKLEPLRVKVPDPRVLIGPMITIPTQTTVPQSKVSFVVYRRDLAMSVPDKVSIRVMARIARAMSFSDGKPVTMNVDAAWVVRGKSYNFGVSPLAENQEMVVIRPESDDFILPAGRYALVFKDLAYDFSVDGEVTDPAQCLERVEALNGNVYSECVNHRAPLARAN